MASTPVGLRLPLQRGSIGFFNQNFNTLDQAYSNIKNLLLTMVGERRLNVNFGSPIYALLFEQITDQEELATSLSDQITNLVNLYFPYVDIKDITITFPNYSLNRVDISLTFQLKNSSTTMFGAAESKTLTVSLNTTV